jgi:uncharacterized protein (TIGR03066 family)
MRALLGASLVLALGCGADKKGARTDAQKLVGKWQEVESQQPRQVTLEFTADGKISVVSSFEGKTSTSTGIYELEEYKLTTVFTAEGSLRKRKTVHKVTKLTDVRLELDDDGFPLKYERVIVK